MLFGPIETHQMLAVASASLGMVGFDYIYRMVMRTPRQFRFRKNDRCWPVRASVEASAFSAFVCGAGLLIGILATAMERTLSLAEFNVAYLMSIMMMCLYPFGYGCVLLLHRYMDDLYIANGGKLRKRDTLPYIGASVLFVSAMWIGIYIGLAFLGARFAG